MTTDQPGSAQTNGRLSTTVVAAVCALSGLVLVGIVVLTALGRPVDNVLSIATAVIVPTIGTLLAAKKLDDITPVVHDVSLKVNGRLDNALNTISALEAQVIASGGTPVTTPTIVAPSPVVLPRHSAENPPAPVPATSEVSSNG